MPIAIVNAIDLWHDGRMTDTVTMLDELDAPQLRELAKRLLTEMSIKNVIIDKLTHEMATLKRLKFAAQGEAFHAGQKTLLEEAIDTDLGALAQEIDRHDPSAAEKGQRRKPKHAPLPALLPRREILHELRSTTCGCQVKRVGR